MELPNWLLEELWKDTLQLIKFSQKKTVELTQLWDSEYKNFGLHLTCKLLLTWTVKKQWLKSSMIYLTKKEYLLKQVHHLLKNSVSV